MLTSVGRRKYLVDYFCDALNGSGTVVGVDMNAYAPALAACDRAYLVPPVTSPDYVDNLISIMISENIKMLFSLNDLELAILSKTRAKIEAATGATVYVPKPEVVEVCADKWAMFNFATENGIASPLSFINLETASAAIVAGTIAFPLIIKPRWGSGSIGLYQVSSLEEMTVKFAECGEVIKNSILSDLGQDDAVIIQEFITGKEYGVDVLFDKTEAFAGFAAKQKLAMRAGETDKAKTVQPSAFEPLVHSLAKALQHRGNLDCDFLEKDGTLYLLEMNPRFGGGYPFTHLAGANHTMRLIQNYQGVASDAYDYDKDRIFSKFDNLVDVTDIGSSPE
ncbi:ATP-grasp domain-containing protein [Planktotalea sp.]|uniref:ATP-grasp domain-containing protein n=1 Tax=Planktotalea sp. TaxID=2029877 RepID=UPI0035C7B022